MDAVTVAQVPPTFRWPSVEPQGKAVKHKEMSENTKDRGSPMVVEIQPVGPARHPRHHKAILPNHVLGAIFRVFQQAV